MWSFISTPLGRSHGGLLKPVSVAATACCRAVQHVKWLWCAVLVPAGCSARSPIRQGCPTHFPPAPPEACRLRLQISWRAPRAASTSAVGDLGRTARHGPGERLPGRRARQLSTRPAGAACSPPSALLLIASSTDGRLASSSRRSTAPGGSAAAPRGRSALCGRGARPGASAR
jgi:hypothetical protein